MSDAGEEYAEAPDPKKKVLERCCGTCGGTGSLWGGPIPDGFGGYRHGLFDCPVCKGKGYLPAEGQPRG